jgi:hypothetical protein
MEMQETREAQKIEEAQESAGNNNPTESQGESREQDKSETPTPPRRTLLDKNLLYIAKLLYAHPGTAAALKNLRAQIREIDNNLIRSGVANYNIGSGGSVSTGDIGVMSSPEADAERRIRKKDALRDKINTLQARYEAIREAVNQLGGKHERIIRVKYFQAWERHNPQGRIWKELGMRKENYERWCREAVEHIGRWIGEWKDPGVKKAEVETEGELGYKAGDKPALKGGDIEK